MKTATTITTRIGRAFTSSSFFHKGHLITRKQSIHLWLQFMPAAMALENAREGSNQCPIDVFNFCDTTNLHLFEYTRHPSPYILVALKTNVFTVLTLTLKSQWCHPRGSQVKSRWATKWVHCERHSEGRGSRLMLSHVLASSGTNSQIEKHKHTSTQI